MKGIIGVCKNYFKKENNIRSDKHQLKIINTISKYDFKPRKFAFLKRYVIR